MKSAQKVIDAVVANGAYRATLYVSDRLVMRATRRLHRGRIPRKTENIEVTVTSGRPNYRERKFIKLCKKAGESFPVRRVQLQFPPKRRSA